MVGDQWEDGPGPAYLMPNLRHYKSVWPGVPGQPDRSAFFPLTCGSISADTLASGTQERVSQARLCRHAVGAGLLRARFTEPEDPPLAQGWHKTLSWGIHIESILMRWMKLEPIIQSEVSQKDKDHYNILTHIYGI